MKRFTFGEKPISHGMNRLTLQGNQEAVCYDINILSDENIFNTYSYTEGNII